VIANKATFVFSSGFSSVILCYQFGTLAETEPYKVYTGLEIIDTAVADVEEVPVFFEAPAEVTLSLEGSVDTIPAGSPARATFEANFVTDISAALGIDTSRVTIIDIISGSIIVIFEIRVSDNAAEPLVSELVEELVAQANDPTSSLNTGNVTSAVQQAPAVAYGEPVERVSGGRAKRPSEAKERSEGAGGVGGGEGALRGTCATSPAAGGVRGVSPRQPEILPVSAVGREEQQQQLRLLLHASEEQQQQRRLLIHASTEKQSSSAFFFMRARSNRAAALSSSRSLRSRPLQPEIPPAKKQWQPANTRRSRRSPSRQRRACP
jgi:hypothetical protein